MRSREICIARRSVVGGDYGISRRDVTSVVPGQQVTVAYGVGNYVNTCRPDSPMCAGCAFSPNCAYNGMDHTKPVYALSAALVVYGR